KTYIFSDFEGEIEGETVLPYNSSYVRMETSSLKITNIKLGYGFFREKVKMLIKRIHLGKDVKILEVQNALKPLMLTIIVLLAEGGRFTILGRHPHRNNLSHITEREQPPYSDNIRYTSARVGCYKTIQERKSLMRTPGYSMADRLSSQLSTYIINRANLSRIARTYVPIKEYGKIPHHCYITKHKEYIIQGIKLPDHSDKEHIEKVFKKYPKLCYFMLPMIWRGKQVRKRF
nr:hypothetical protein [Tanacetum cinerariifolium]